MEDDDIKRLYHRGGHDTEREAAAAIFPHLNRIQAEVLAYARTIWPLGFTQREISLAMKSESYSTYRTRVAELRDMKLIEDTGVRRQHPPSKRNCIVWRYKPVQLPLPFKETDR